MQEKNVEEDFKWTVEGPTTFLSNIMSSIDIISSQNLLRTKELNKNNGVNIVVGNIQFLNTQDKNHVFEDMTLKSQDRIPKRGVNWVLKIPCKL